MTYSPEQMHEIERDPVRLKAYFWTVAQNMRRMAARDRTASRRTGVVHPVTKYKQEFEEGLNMTRWANTLENVSREILQNLDALVASTLVKD